MYGPATSLGHARPALDAERSSCYASACGSIDLAAQAVLCRAATVTRICAIGGSLNGKPATVETGLWFEAGDGARRMIIFEPRIRVDYAGPHLGGPPSMLRTPCAHKAGPNGLHTNTKTID